MSLIGKIITRYKHKKIEKLKKTLKYCGNNVVIKENVQFNHNYNIELGDNVYINRDCTFSGHDSLKVDIGTVFAHCVDVFTGEHNYDSLDLEYLPFDERFNLGPVNIGKYVWVGAHVVIMPGVTIGDGAIIGACSVVTKDIPSCAIAVGNPAKVIKYRNKEKFVELCKENKSFIGEKRRQK